MKKYYLFFIIVFLLTISGQICGQAITAPIEDSPLSKPSYLTIVSIQKINSEKLMQIVVDSVKKYGFNDINTDLKDYNIEAKKHDITDSRNYCKILLWFERDFSEPEKFLKVYLLCGRYEYILSNKSESHRIKLSESKDELYFKKLRDSIKSIASGQ